MCICTYTHTIHMVDTKLTRQYSLFSHFPTGIPLPHWIPAPGRSSWRRLRARPASGGSGAGSATLGFRVRCPSAAFVSRRSVRSGAAVESSCSGPSPLQIALVFNCVPSFPLTRVSRERNRHGQPPASKQMGGIPLLRNSFLGLPCVRASPAPRHCAGSPRAGPAVAGRPNPAAAAGKGGGPDKPVYPARPFLQGMPMRFDHLWWAALLLRPPSAHAFSYGLPHGSAKAAISVAVWQHWTAAHSKSCTSNVISS